MRDWLARTLQEYSGRHRLVVTHHVPHPRTLEKWPGGGWPFWSWGPYVAWALGAYSSDGSKLLAYAEHWIHGDTHRVENYPLHGCRVLNNPAVDADHDAARWLELEITP